MTPDKELDKTLSSIGAQVRELREESKASQETFADKAGIDRAQLTRIEGGKINLTVRTLLKIARATGRKLHIRLTRDSP